MKINILSIGKFAKSDANKELFLKYQKRLAWKVELKEIELKKTNLSNLSSANLKIEEGKILLSKVPTSSKIIALDEKGKMKTSPGFANLIKNYGLQGSSNLTFIIGGSEGLSDEVKNKADLILSFSQMTFPHLMIRSFLIEQIYRAYTIINDHPYHRI